MVLEDNRDNNNNRKNGRNIECHEVTYNTDNRDYLFYYGCPPLSVLSFKNSLISVLSFKKSVMSLLSFKKSIHP